MNTEAIILILEQIEAKIEDHPQLSLDGTIYESVEELLEDINDFIIELEEGNVEAIEYIDIHFLKGATFELLATKNSWANHYQTWVTDYEAAK